MITDYDECATENGGCGRDTCTNTLGSFVCTCKDGTILPEGQTNCGKYVLVKTLFKK